MRWTIQWSHACDADVRRMRSWRLAESICKAIRRYAETGDAIVERAAPGDPYQIRIRVVGASAIARADISSRTLYIWRIYSS